MADGTTKPISAVEVGDWVLAEDPETGERGPREVTHLWVHQDTIIDLEIDGHDVATTQDHPFWNHTDSEWQAASTLDVGDLVLTADGATPTVDGLDWGSARTTTAYNLTVDDIHTYFVEVGGEPVLVHNVCDNAWDIAHKSFGDHDIPGISSIDELATYVDDVMRGPGYDIPGSDGLRRAWWDNDRGVVVISDLTTSWSPGSVYRPDDGYAYFRRLIEGDL